MGSINGFSDMLPISSEGPSTRRISISRTMQTIESAANKYTFVWRKTTEKNKAKLETKIRDILSQIDNGIAQDNSPIEDTAAIDSSTLQNIINDINEKNRKKAAEGASKKVLKEMDRTVKKLEKAKEIVHFLHVILDS